MPLAFTQRLTVAIMKGKEKHPRRTYPSRRLWNKCPHFRKKKWKADRCQKKLSLNQCNFLPSRPWLKGPFGVFFSTFNDIFFLHWDTTVNHNRHAARKRKGGLWNLSSASERLLMFFFDQDIGLKAYCSFFTSGSTFITSNIIISFLERCWRLYMCIWLSFICFCSPKE